MAVALGIGPCDVILCMQLPESLALCAPTERHRRSLSRGDRRHGSMKRVAAVVDEGSFAIELVHQYLDRF